MIELLEYTPIPVMPPATAANFSLIDLAARSRLLGSDMADDDSAKNLRVEILEEKRYATAEAYVTERTDSRGLTRVHLVLDHGLPAEATLPTLQADWLGVHEGQIVLTRLDPAIAVEQGAYS